MGAAAIFLLLAAASGGAAGDDPPATVDEAEEPAVRADSEEPEESGKAARYYPRFTLVSLGSLGLRVDDLRVDDLRGGTVKRTETTAFGSLDFLLQATLSDQFSVLAQLAVDAEDGGGEDGGSEDFQVEQFQLAYAHSDRFRLRLGKFHTALGYWNRTYHNIPWLRASIFRPEIFRLENEDGLLPVHSVGLEASGKRDAGKLRLAYSLGVVKGRTAVIGDAVKLEDIGDADGVNLQLELTRSSEHNLARELRFGLSGYAETIPADPAGGRPGKIDEVIFGAHVVWSIANGELLGEYLRIHHDGASGDFKSEGFYYQYSLVFKRLRIYERFDQVSLDDADPYFGALADRRDIRRITTGVRWDVRPWLGLTGEYSYASRDNLPDSNRIALQLSFSLKSWE